jgi:uncharacterized Zn-finger protein
MRVTEFTPEGKMVDLETQDFLPIYAMETRLPESRSNVRGAGLFTSNDVLPLLKTNQQTPWSNLKSSTRNIMSKAGQSAKNKVLRKNVRYETLVEEDSTEPSENETESEKDYSLDTKPLKIVQKPKNTEIVCSICQQEFANSFNLERHTRSIHSLIKFKCDACGHLFSREDVLKSHENICKKKT